MSKCLQIYKGVCQMQGLTAPSPWQHRHMTGEEGALTPLAVRWQGSQNTPQALAEHRNQSGGVAPAGMAFFLAILLAAGVRQWKEVHRNGDHAAVNPVKYNSIFLGIFS